MGKTGRVEEIATEYANAKLTRTLTVTGVREDGYHLISAEMVSLDLCDTLEISSGVGLSLVDAIMWTGGNSASESGFSVPTDDSNLVARALALAGARAKVVLTKRIPAGAGLGGGSSDAAAILRHFGVEDPALGAQLGADVPFCITGGRALVTGVGEILEPMPFVDRNFVIVTPNFGVSTVSVYRAFDEIGVGELATTPNDLTAAAFAVEPRLVDWHDLFAQESKLPVVLAGSGSSLFVECERDAQTELVARMRKRVSERGERALVTPAKTVGSSRG